jgi:hypothetical protein
LWEYVDRNALALLQHDGISSYAPSRLAHQITRSLCCCVLCAVVAFLSAPEATLTRFLSRSTLSAEEDVIYRRVAQWLRLQRQSASDETNVVWRLLVDRVLVSCVRFPLLTLDQFNSEVQPHLALLDTLTIVSLMILLIDIIMIGGIRWIIDGHRYPCNVGMVCACNRCSELINYNK